ncbi:HK97 family phage prohead protease [Agromyces lapidis]|uniref:HK97 family phage prohead protease n=1 Tax=Agromyces lapidis TaxID=279574 RepID=A0ABV5SMG3_9MICO|nr:HK97 family phage prohead protease [Agromyces lapidis]
MRDLEMRHVSQPVEFRSADDGPGTLDGYAIVFNKYSQNLGGFVERVDPSAATKSVSDKLPVVARYNHDDNFLLGTIEAGTLRLEVDDVGVRYIVDLPDTSAGRDVAALAKRGDLRYSSFAFHTLEDEWGVTEQGFPLRTLRSIQLVDVAPVVNPAYRDSTVGVRSLAEHLHIEVDAVAAASTEELRSLLSGEPVESPVEVRAEEQEEEGQSETHPSISLRQRLLELDNLK